MNVMKRKECRTCKRSVIRLSIFCISAFFVAVLIFTSVSEARSARDLTGAPGSFSSLVKDASPSVVYISTVKIIKSSVRGLKRFQLPLNPDDPFNDFFEHFFGEQMPRDFRQKSLGSGFIIDKDGYILTNNHVVEKTDEIKVRLADGKEFIAKIVGRDPKTDLALIRIKADTPLKPLKLGNSDKLEVGDWVIAIGNPFGLGNSVTAGIVSAKYRHIGTGIYDNFIQTDAPINPGNSGGPLLDAKGEVIGINSVIFTKSGGSLGIGFAIPVNMAKDLLPQLKKGKVERGWLGVMVQKITPELRGILGLQNDNGALVADVSDGGPAEKAGIKRGDVIVSFDGKKIKEMNDLPYIVASTRVGKKVKISIIRKGREKSCYVKVGELQEKKEVQSASKVRPDFGMVVEDIRPELKRRFGLTESSGVVVVQVEQGSSSAEAGLRPGDIILEIHYMPIRNIDQFTKKMSTYKKGDTILFLIKRQDATIYLTLHIRD